MTIETRFGKGQELSIVSKLLGEEFDVYLPVVDDQGIDCIIRISDDKHLDIQIKASSKKSDQPRNYGAIKIKPRENYYFVFYSELDKKLWTIPTMDFSSLWETTKKKDSKHYGGFNVYIPKPGNQRYTDKDYGRYEGFRTIKALNRH